MLNITKTQSRPKLLFLVPAISQTHKSLENSQDFFCQDQDQDFYLKTKTKTLGLKTKTLFFVLEAPRDQDFGLEDYITGGTTSCARTSVSWQFYVYSCSDPIRTLWVCIMHQC